MSEKRTVEEKEKKAKQNKQKRKTRNRGGNWDGGQTLRKANHHQN